MDINKYKLKGGEVWEYELYTDDNGFERLRKCGYRNQHKEIQMRAKGVGIEHYVQTDSQGNIQSVLNKNTEGFYGDFTEVPQTMSEARKQLKTAKDTAEWLKQESLRQEGAEAEKKKAEALKTAKTEVKEADKKVEKKEESK